LQCFFIQLIDVVITVRFCADQTDLRQFGKMMRNRGGFQIKQHGEFLHAVGLTGKQSNDLEAVRIRESLEEIHKFFAHADLQ
jgi:uncharacterized protein GlcG (DUF336 family)